VDETDRRQTAAPATARAAVPRALILSWMFLFGMIGTGLVGPNLSSIEREFRISHGQFGIVFALIQIACSTVVLFAASRLRRLDSSLAFIAGLLMQTAGFVCIYLAPCTTALAGGWTLITLGTVLGAVANNVSARLWPDNPRRGVTLLHGFNGIGKVAGPLVAAVCLLLGWRLSFLAVGVVTLVLLAGFWRERRRLAEFSAPEEAAPSGTGEALRRPFYWLCILPFGLIAGGDVCFAALLPAYYERTHGLSPQGASLLLTAHLLGLAVGRFVFVYLSDRLSNNRVIGLCLLAGLFVVPAILARHPWAWAAALFGVGWMFSSTWPTYYAQVSRFFSRDPHMLDYGSGLGNALGIALCVWGSSSLAERYPEAALLCGPAALWLFGLLYFLSPLSRPAPLSLVETKT